MLRNIKLVLAYDGADFHGWQFQPGLRTVQGCLEQALRRVARHQVVVIGAGRTDARVHASGQVANFFTTHPMPVGRMAQAVGSRLPKDMTLVHASEVPLTFHSTHRAVSKLYRYRVHNAQGRPCERMQHRYVYHVWQPLDVGAMRCAARAWVGRHDFSAFAAAGNVRRSNVREVIRIEIYRVEREVRFDIEGTGFLYNQVRNMVGTLIEIGRGEWPMEKGVEILESRSRRMAGPTAPARGLCMQWVRYDLPGLPEASEASLERARAATAPKGAANQEVDARPRSTAPLPPGYDTDEAAPA